MDPERLAIPARAYEALSKGYGWECLLGEDCPDHGKPHAHVHGVIFEPGSDAPPVPTIGNYTVNIALSGLQELKDARRQATALCTELAKAERRLTRVAAKQAALGDVAKLIEADETPPTDPNA